jgi:nucleotide-binding universal stress UspA family protein
MKLLLAVDGSMFSEAAIRAVTARIRSENTEVLLLHVIEPAAFFEQDESLRERSSRTQLWLNGAARELEANGFKDVETRVVEAEARTGILSIVEQWQPDLIVLGSHGRKGLDRFLMGSVAESIARHASCSVLIVRLPLARCHERVQNEYRFGPATAAD